MALHQAMAAITAPPFLPAFVGEFAQPLPRLFSRAFSLKNVPCPTLERAQAKACETLWDW
jgi:hypothetical protein